MSCDSKHNIHIASIPCPTTHSSDTKTTQSFAFCIAYQTRHLPLAQRTHMQSCPSRNCQKSCSRAFSGTSISLGPEYSFRRENTLLRRSLVSCMRVTEPLYRLAEPVLYNTVTSDRLVAILCYSVGERHDRIAGEVRELYACYHESHASIPISSPVGMISVRPEESPAQPEDIRLRFHGKWSWSIADRRTLQSRFPVLNSLPVARLQVEMCPNLGVLVLSSGCFAQLVLPPSFLRDCITHNPSWPRGPHTPLANLCRFEIDAHAFHRDYIDLHSDDWFLLLAQLPRLESISVPKIMEQAFASTQEQEQTPILKSLALTSQTPTPGLLEAIFRAFPFLETLSVTWPDFEIDPIATTDIWPQLGHALSNHGQSLRKIHFESLHSPVDQSPRGSPVDLAPLRGLRSLALPIEAILTEPAGHYLVPAETSDIGYYLTGTHAAGDGANTLTIPLYHILPPNLRHLTITDDWNLWADAYRLDNQLRGLMADPTFLELRSVRLRRRRPFIHFGGLDWFDHTPNQFWQVVKRTRSTRQDPELDPEPRLREI